MFSRFDKIKAANMKFITWMFNITRVIAAIMIVVSFLMNRNWEFLINGIVTLLLYTGLKKLVFWFFLEK